VGATLLLRSAGRLRTAFGPVPGSIAKRHRDRFALLKSALGRTRPWRASRIDSELLCIRACLAVAEGRRACHAVGRRGDWRRVICGLNLSYGGVALGKSGALATTKKS